MLWAPGLEQGKENSLPRGAERRGSEQHFVLPARCGRCKCGGAPGRTISMCIGGGWAQPPNLNARGVCSRLARRARGQLWAVRCRCSLGGCHLFCVLAGFASQQWLHRVPYGFTFVAHAGPEPGQKQPHSARCYSNTRSPSPPPGVVPHGWRLCSRQRCRLILFRGFRRRKKKKGGVIAVLVTGLLLTDPDDFSRTKAH